MVLALVAGLLSIKSGVLPGLRKAFWLGTDDRIHAYELIQPVLDPAHVYREMQGTALAMSADALRLLGFEAEQAARAARIFDERDQANLAEMAALYDGNREVCVSTARQHVQNLENLLRADGAGKAEG